MIWNPLKLLSLLFVPILLLPLYFSKDVWFVGMEFICNLYFSLSLGLMAFHVCHWVNREILAIIIFDRLQVDYEFIKWYEGGVGLCWVIFCIQIDIQLGQLIDAPRTDAVIPQLKGDRLLFLNSITASLLPCHIARSLYLH